MGVKFFSGGTLSFSLMLIIHLATAATPIAKPNCEDHCGNISIPYPFGMGNGCYMTKWFEIECDKISNPPRSFIKSINMEVLNISINGNATIKGPIISSNCPGRDAGLPVNLTGTPFFLSSINYLTAVGCNTRVLVSDSKSRFYGCDSTCSGEMPNPVAATGSNASVPVQEYRCSAGYNCCRIGMPFASLQVFHPSLQAKDDNQSNDGCKLAFLADGDWQYKELMDPYKVQLMEFVPLTLAWKMNSSGWKYDYKSMDCIRILTANSSYDFVTQCSCRVGYEGNPSLGCIDINECKLQNEQRLCQGITKCVNTPGSYKCAVDPKWIITIVGSIVGFMTLFPLIVGGCWRREVLKKRKQIERRKAFFKQALRQQLHLDYNSFEKASMYLSIKDIQKATDHFNVSRILGKGGQGTVYKGMLIDGRIVAIKKPSKIDEQQFEAFINEVVILSQINHRNVVKLLGCCLETEVPMIAYEFIPNGTLYQYLHDQNIDFFLSWEMRFQIAIQISEALAYLHSAATLPIYHRDIKSTNILLDEKYQAKVSDFGISRLSSSIDQTHLTTNVQGTFGYLDPEYFRSGRFTEKSDVYSFGILLIELLTGKKPIFSSEMQEVISLASHFLQSMEHDELESITDPKIMKHYVKEEVVAVANVAKRCLHSSGNRRPTMKEVAIEMEGIRTSKQDMNVQQNSKEIESDIEDAATVSACSSLNISDETISLDVQPLVSSRTW